MLQPFTWATEDKVQHQGRHGSRSAGQGSARPFLGERGFDVAERFVVPFAFELADPETYARAIASTGPAYESIQRIGEEAFVARATELAATHVREGLPLRGEVQALRLHRHEGERGPPGR